MPQKFQRLKNSRRFKKSSASWLLRQVNDEFVHKAKQEGWRCRAAFKLIEIDEKFKIFSKNKIVVDLGSAPGGWSQYCVEKVGFGNVLALDLLEMPAISGVEFLQLDFLDEKAIPKIEERLSKMRAKNQVKTSKINNSGVSSLSLPSLRIQDQKDQNHKAQTELEPNVKSTEFAQNQNSKILPTVCDILLSDMAANTTGQRELDHIRIIDLLEEALKLAVKILAPSGCFIAKIFQGGSSDFITDQLRANFSSVHYFKPKSSRQTSRECYLVAIDFKKTKTILKNR